MNPDTEASSSCSSTEYPDGMTKLAVASLHVKSIVDNCKDLREQVESVQNLNTLIFYSRLIHAAVESINTMINEWNAMFPNWEEDETKAFDYCCKKACDIYKGTTTMLSNSILTSSTTNKTGDSKKVLMWKKQCDKNIDKIASLIKNALMKDYSNWFDTLGISGIYHATCAILSSLHQILLLKESVDDAQFKILAVVVLNNMEMRYKTLINRQQEHVIQSTAKDLLEILNLKNSEKEDEAVEKLQEDIVKRFQEETTLMQKILQEEESQKNSQEVEINKKLQEEETQKKLREDEALKKLKERQ